jgi:predicted  nucleic acid-binding Zn-ribbon protein|nr:MAG TPA: Hemolysin [Caudoviricetes sp.]DAJ91449.1 MAG TPA: hemolysin [Caudoviricetes sp.]DAT68922.1 MAG TPA: hemolysin [Caudoviricetes sp.]
MDDGIQAKIAEIEARSKSNTHRIDDLEEDNRALHTLATSVEVLATKQDTIESTVQEIKTDVKELKAVPGSKWEALVKAVVTAIVGALVGFALAHAGIV